MVLLHCLANELMPPIFVLVFSWPCEMTQQLKWLAWQVCWLELDSSITEVEDSYLLKVVCRAPHDAYVSVLTHMPYTHRKIWNILDRLFFKDVAICFPIDLFLWLFYCHKCNSQIADSCPTFLSWLNSNRNIPKLKRIELWYYFMF